MVRPSDESVKGLSPPIVPLVSSCSLKGAVAKARGSTGLFIVTVTVPESTPVEPEAGLEDTKVNGVVSGPGPVVKVVNRLAPKPMYTLYTVFGLRAANGTNRK